MYKIYIKLLIDNCYLHSKENHFLLIIDPQNYKKLDDYLRGVFIYKNGMYDYLNWYLSDTTQKKSYKIKCIQ